MMSLYLLEGDRSKTHMKDMAHTRNYQLVLELLQHLHSLDDNLYSGAIDTLRRDSQAVEPVLVEFLTSSTVQVRCDASKAIRLINPSRAVEYLKPLLYDENRTVRSHTCGVLYDIGDSRAVPDLIQVLQSDQEGNVRYAAAIALGKIGDRRALPALQWAAENDSGLNAHDSPVSLAAQQAIGWIVTKRDK